MIANMRCLSEKTSLNFDELKFSLVCHRFGQKRSLEDSGDGFTGTGPPVKKRIVVTEDGAFSYRTDPRVSSTQTSPVPPSSFSSQTTYANTGFELTEELLCYFALSQSADKVLATFELILKLVSVQI